MKPLVSPSGEPGNSVSRELRSAHTFEQSHSRKPSRPAVLLSDSSPPQQESPVTPFADDRQTGDSPTVDVEPPRVIVVGETGGSLSEMFRKRNPSKQRETRPSRTSNKGKDGAEFRSKEGKEALRKKMMQYGKKEQTKKEKPKVESEFSQLISQVDAAKKKLSEAKAQELERMARGIKPKINRSEIKEITKRNMKRFAQNTIHESKVEQQKMVIEESRSIQAKRDEVKLRKLKAMELDKVAT